MHAAVFNIGEVFAKDIRNCAGKSNILKRYNTVNSGIQEYNRTS
jgi:hypothetical protein